MTASRKPDKKNPDAGLLRKQAEKTARKKPENLEALSPAAVKKLLHELRVHQIELEMQNDELRTALERLEEAREQYFNLYDMAPVGYFTISEKGIILEANLTAANMLGVLPGELRAQRFTSFIYEEDQDVYYQHGRKLLKTLAPQVSEMRMVRRDGSLFWARVETGLAQDGKSGKPVCRTTMSDVTEHKQAQETLRKSEALQESEASYRSIIECSSDAIFCVDENGQYKFANHLFASTFGKTPDYFIGKTFWDIYPKEHADYRYAATKRVFQTGQSESLEVEVPLPDKTLFFYATANPMKDETGKVILSLTHATDITERKRAEEALQKSEERLREVLENSIDVAYKRNLQTDTYDYLSPSFARISGYAPGEMNALPLETVENLMHPDDTAEVQRVIAESMTNPDNKPYQMEYRFKHKQGHYRWFQDRYIVMRDERGQPLALIGSVSDITERKWVEDALARSEERYRLLANNSNDVIWTLDSQFRFTYISPSIFSLRGLTAEEAMKEDLSETLTPASLQQVQEEIAVGLAAIEQGQMEKTFRLEIEQYRKDGSTVWVEIAVSALIDDTGKLLGFIGISRDITARRKVEEALRDSEKLYRSLFENMHNGFAYCKMLFEQNQPRDFIYLSVNSAFEKQTGLNDISGKKVSEVIPGIYESDRQLIETYGRVALTGVPETFETYLAALDMWFSISVYSPAKEYFVAIFDVITERKRGEAYREMVREVLQILNDPGDLRDSIQRVLAAMKTRTGFDAVGIRLQDGDDFPYFAQDGFPKDFLVTENTLTERSVDGGLCRNKDGSVSLECTCGLVISGKTDPSNPLFTPGGSSWTNDSFPFLDVPADEDPRFHPRNECIHQGYASVALVPIRNKDGIVGLIQFNDHRKGRFSLDAIEQFEDIASHIGEALIRKVNEEALALSEERYRTTLENMQDSYIEVDLAGNFTFVNEATCRNLGYAQEELIGQSFSKIAPDQDEVKAIFQAYGNVYKTGEPHKGFVFKAIRKDSSTGYAETSISVIKNEQGRPIGFRSVGRDVTERKQMEQKLEEMATHDALTSLPNRTLLYDRIGIAMANAQRNKKKVAIMSLDLDFFKRVNDTLGHAMGDKLLIAAAGRLTGALRKSDTVARMGGDEFVLILWEVDHKEDAVGVAEKILEDFRQPFTIDGHSLNVTVSIGMAIYPENGDSMKNLLKCSDKMLYAAKQNGRDRFAI